ncbi:MAG: hypothetical protein LQ340_002285 [Diploschistes diacapsis]|nr:MAG: hypothetical protein LQ340_002285 [Diploschistes diacapsis]
MLPKPTSSFTLPSVHDDTQLECRIYHPPRDTRAERKIPRKGAVIAHAYAPLGGCIDDPVIHFIGEAFLKQGYVLGLFNFRGAGASKGRTSWSGKPEQADYVSFIGFFMLYMYGLYCNVSIASPSQSSMSNPITLSSSGPFSSEAAERLTLVLGGYSYGSLMSSQLPDIETIIAIFTQPVKGSAAAEIRLRALHLSKEWSIEARRSRLRERTLAVEDSLEGSAYGGDEYAPSTRRTSREFRRSLDVVRKGVEVSKAHLHLRKGSSEEMSRSAVSEEQLESLCIPRPNIGRLLISPVLPPVSSFLTMFGKQWRPLGSSSSVSLPNTAAKVQSDRNRTFAVFGDNDFFTSSKKLQKWATSLANPLDSGFSYKEVAGAGHFWQEQGAKTELERSIVSWLKLLTVRRNRLNKGNTSY